VSVVAASAGAPVDAPLARLDVAYVVQGYPKVSHAFIQREVISLRLAGARVQTYTLRRADAAEVKTALDRSEAASTTALRPIPPARLARIHATWLARAPRAYGRTLRASLAAAPPGARARLRQVLYFGQAVVLHDELAGRSARHVHAHLANVAVDVTWLATELGNRAGTGSWTWSFTMHGPTELREVTRFNLARKVRAAHLVACISDYCRSQLMALVEPEHWGKLVVVHCGVDRVAFTPSDRRDRPVRRLLSVGRLVPEKAQSLLLGAIADLVERGHDVVATIVGDGPDRDRLRRERDRLGLADRVELPGALGQDALRPRYDAADVFVLASFDEGVPVVLMEAMASGLPVVATRIAGIPELIDDGETGLLVPPGRVDALVDAVARLVKDGDLRERLAGAGRDRVTAQFDAQVEAERLGAAILDVTGSRA
jgi:glycosyltransferase involved in cell wall biosynthesis